MCLFNSPIRERLCRPALHHSPAPPAVARRSLSFWESALLRFGHRKQFDALQNASCADLSPTLRNAFSFTTMSLSTQHKVVIITGCSKGGIGFAL